jgi:mono/diheme cytochrome c family protein
MFSSIAACAALLFNVAAWADKGHERAASAGTPDAAALYHDYCSVCHGDKGDGDSRARGSMVPPPRDFTAPAARSIDRDTLIAAVTKGRAGTAMAPWESQLSVAQVAGVVDYIRETFMGQGDSAVAQGARIYARTCSVCHGDNGSGAMWATTSLNPRPRDLTSASAAAELSRSRMIHSVTYGRPDTAMPGFESQLDAHQIEAVVAYVRQTFMPQLPASAVTAAAGHGHEKQNTGHQHGSRHEHDQHLGVAAVHAEPFADGLVGDSARGEALYRSNCVACHGEEGNGQGPRAYFILPKPRNFTHPASRSAFNRPHLFQAISRGRVGTEMAAWDTVLDAQSIADIAEYVFQRFILAGQVVGSAAPAADSASSK